MKRRGCEEMDGSTRDICRKLDVEVSRALGGMKTPSSRKDLMLDMRRRDEAEGDSRMMGCSRPRVGFLRFEVRVWAGAAGFAS